MAAMAASVSSSGLPSSSSMNSSHSSEGSYVVVDKSFCSENSQPVQSSEDGEREIQPKSGSLLEAGSAPRDVLERVQNLTKENEELKGVLFQNNKLLEKYVQELASMQKNQKQTNESLRKGYDQAKVAVKNLREKNSCLKTDLKIEQDRNVQLEEQLAKMKDGKLQESSPQLDDKQGGTASPASQMQTLQDVISRLEIEKVTLMTENCKLEDHISCLKAMREDEQNIEGDECHTLVSFGSITSPSDEPSVETIQDKYSKLETEKEILKVDLQKLKIEGEQTKQDYRQMEEDHNKLLKKLADVEQKQAQAQDDALANSEQVAGLTQQLQVQTEALSTLKEELDNVRQERELYKKKVEELELIKESTETEQAMTQTEHGALNQQSEVENKDVDKLKEELLNLTQERDTYKMKLDEFQNHLEAAKASAEDAFGQVEDTEMKEKYVKLRDHLWTYQKREAEILARENALYQEKEEAQKQETAEKEEIERLKQLLHDYEKRNREALETAYKQEAFQVELTEEIRKLKQQFETERAEHGQQVDNLIQERDTYKMKVEDSQMQPAAEQGKTGAEEALGAVPDADLKEKFIKVRNQLWNYQKRDNDIQDRENEVLVKEEAAKQLLEEKEKLQQELAGALVKVEMLTQEKKKQEEEAQLLERQLSETHEQEVLVLKEELQNKSTDMVAVQTSEEQLKAQVANLQQENQNLVMECEKCKADCTKQEEEAQSLKRQLSETLEHEVEALKVELQNKSTILEQAQTSEEHLKTQVTQLLQENHAYGIELERLKEDLQQQENMYQDHLHKITQDSEHQRQKRDEMIKNLRTQLLNTEGELQNARAQLAAENKTLRELQEKQETILAEYQEMLQSYDTILHTNKEQEMEKSALHSHVGELTVHLKEADRFGAKLKEDIRLRDDELSNLRERTFLLQKREEQFPILEAQLEVYRTDFQVEREAREKQHEEILRLREETQRLQQENQRYQDEIDRLGNEQIAEMQRRHGSFVQEPQQPQQPRGWFDAIMPLFPRGGPEMQEGHQTPDQGRMGGGAQEQRAGDVETEAWQCPTCRREFPNFDNLQIHAVECNGPQPAPENQCPKCMDVFPDWDTLAIHVEECLEQD